MNIYIADKRRPEWFLNWRSEAWKEDCLKKAEMCEKAEI